jgi:Rrf2 family protein
MKFSSKTEYGLKAVLNLALNPKIYKSATQIAKEEHISLKYLERILGHLKKHNLLESSKGKSGGYKIKGKLKDINLEKIITALEGPISFSKCLSLKCPDPKCHLRNVWINLTQEINKSLAKIKLEDIIKK